MSHQAIRRAFRWRVPERFNIGVAACDALAEGAFVNTLPLTTTGKVMRRMLCVRAPDKTPDR